MSKLTIVSAYGLTAGFEYNNKTYGPEELKDKFIVQFHASNNQTKPPTDCHYNPNEEGLNHILSLNADEAKKVTELHEYDTDPDVYVFRSDNTSNNLFLSFALEGTPHFQYGIDKAQARSLWDQLIQHGWKPLE